jgi:hypothetical protein
MSQPAVSPICPSIPRPSLPQRPRPQAPLPPRPHRSRQRRPPSRLLRSRLNPRPHQARTCLRSRRPTPSLTLPTIRSRSNSLDPKLPSFPLWLHHPSPPLPSPPRRLFLLSLHRPPRPRLRQLQPSKSRTKLSTRRYIVRVLVRSLLFKPRCILADRTARHIPSAVRMARQVLLLLFLNTLVISTHLASTLLANSFLRLCNLRAVLSTLLSSHNISNTSDPIPDKTHSTISRNRLTLQDLRMAHPWLRLNTMATTPAPLMGMRTVTVMVRVETRL